MTRRFLAVLLVVLAALTALAVLLTLTTRGEEPLSDAAIPTAWSADRGKGETRPEFRAPEGERGDSTRAAPPSLPANTDPSQALASLATVRIEVNETAQRVTPVAAWLRREGEEEPAFVAELADHHEWPDVPPGRWELGVNPGWKADVSRFELAAGGRQLVRITARNRVSGLLLAARTGRPVEHATITTHFFRSEPTKGAEYMGISPVRAEAPGGHFSLAAFNLPFALEDLRFAVFHATTEGLIEGESAPVRFGADSFLSDVMITFPEPILTGRVRGTDPDLGDVPVPGASIQLLPADASLEKFVFSAGAAFTGPEDTSALPDADADVEGAFVFGPIPEAPVVLRVRALVTAYQWMETLSDPFEIDQRTTLRDVEFRLKRGGRLYAKLLVPLTPGAGPGEFQPVARPESMTMAWLDPPPGTTPPYRVPIARQVIPSRDPKNALFEFDEGGFPAGRWRCLVVLEPTEEGAAQGVGRQTILTEVEIVDGQRTDVLLEYPSNEGVREVTGTVRLPEDFLPNVFDVVLSGAPEAGLLPTPVAVASVNPAGEFELHDAPRGDWTLVVFASTARRRDVAVGSVFVAVGSSSPPPIHLDLTHPQVLIQAGEKTRGRRLILGGRCGDPILDAAIAAGRMSVQPDAEGAARILGLLPAHWTLSAEGGPPVQVEFDLPAGAGTVRVELP